MFEKNLKGGISKVMNKKGLSNIIATVLIILLALAAVVIVWQFVRPVIEGGGQSVSLEAKCLEVEVAPTKCTLATGQYTVTIQLKKGTAYQVIGTITSTNSLTAASAAVPAPTSTFGTVNTGSITPPTGGTGTYTAKAVAIVQDSTSLQTKTCSESSVTVTCA